MLRAWLVSFVFTQAVELSVAAAAAPAHRARVVATQLVGTTLTHPLLWTVASATGGGFVAVAIAEPVIVLVEALVLWRSSGLGPRDALMVSALANGASYLAGQLLRRAGWWPDG